jgi:hypothetical protein
MKSGVWSITDKREILYEELNEEGQLFVDGLTESILSGFIKHRGKRNVPMGKVSARELAMSILQHCWNGKLPASFPVLVDVEKAEL